MEEKERLSEQLKNKYPINKYTREKLIEVIGDLFKRPDDYDENRTVDITDFVMGVRRKAYELSPLKDKILDGYWYEFDTGKPLVDGERQIKVNTGIGGAREYMKMLFEQGLPPEYIGDIIFVYTDMGRFSLNQLNVKKDGTNTNK